MFDETITVEALMKQWPATMRAFLDHRMHCIGCPIACFHTIRDACREHDVEVDVFMADLRKILAAGETRNLTVETGAPATGN